MDFMTDQTFDGRKLRIIVDAAARLCAAIDVRATYRGACVVEAERVTAIHGRPRRIPTDQGIGFTSKEMDLWVWKHGVVMDFSRPGKPTDNAFAKAFNSRVCAELLSANWFLSLADARAKCAKEPARFSLLAVQSRLPDLNEPGKAAVEKDVDVAMHPTRLHGKPHSGRGRPRLATRYCEEGGVESRYNSWRDEPSRPPLSILDPIHAAAPMDRATVMAGLRFLNC